MTDNWYQNVPKIIVEIVGEEKKYTSIVNMLEISKVIGQPPSCKYGAVIENFANGCVTGIVWNSGIV